MSPSFPQLFRLRLEGREALPFSEFMSLALFDPAVGYYAAPRRRVGRARGTDFYTATSLGPLFGRLVAACSAEIIESAGWSANEATFVEIGAEPGGGVMGGVEHPFKSSHALRLEDAARLEASLEELGGAGPLVVFSNELLDAQPVERWTRVEGAWRQAAVRLEEGGNLAWSTLETPPPAWLTADPLLDEAPDGWIVDAPREAEALVRRLAGARWAGAFVAFDYGMTWASLARERPAGTLRAYREHRLESDLLAQPGEQDLTAHVCWDWIEVALRDAGFQALAVEFQETFLVRHGAAELERIVAAAATQRRPGDARTVQELLHPGRMGQRFQVISGWRAE